MPRKKNTTVTSDLSKEPEQKKATSPTLIKRKMTETVNVYECSECHNTTWAELPVCPKCGAEFVKTTV